MNGPENRTERVQETGRVLVVDGRDLTFGISFAGRSDHATDLTAKISVIAGVENDVAPIVAGALPPKRRFQQLEIFSSADFDNFNTVRAESSILLPNRSERILHHLAKAKVHRRVSNNVQHRFGVQPQPT